MASGPDTRLVRYGGWLPSRPVHRAFLARLVEAVPKAPTPGDSKALPEHIPAVAEFEKVIRADSVMMDLFNNAFLQADQEELLVKDFDCLLYSFDQILPSAPHFCPLKDKDGNEVGEPVGVPIYLVLDVLSNTSAAYDLFRMKTFNDTLKKLLTSWHDFLIGDKSNNTLNEGENGWFSKTALIKLETHLDGRTFKDTYIWDAFFVREFQPGQRPIIPLPADQKGTLIYNACESTVYHTAYNVKAHDKFWLKGMKYSLYDILNHNEQDAKLFENGTVYQAFLSPLDYHRWHSPVDGTITKIVPLDGSYYAALPDDGAEKDDPDLKEGDPRGAIIRSQAFLNVSAARALIFIQADSDDIGLMCFVGVGMVEVSTCTVTVKESQKVKAGDELGMFHFGGSTHTLIFGPQSTVTFENDVKVDTHLEVNRIIAKAIKNPKSKTGGSSK